jgi:hypothetical protein
MPKKPPEDDFSHVPNVVYAPPMQLKPSRVLVGLLAGVVVAALGVVGYLLVDKFILGEEATRVPKIEIKKTTSSTSNATSSATKDETASWETYENEEHGYLLKYPKNWYKSTETKVVNEENDIVYHFFAVTKEENKTEGLTDQVIIIRYLEGDPCAQMEIKKSDVMVFGYKGQRSDCYENGQIKVILISFPNTARENWFLLAYVAKDLKVVEKILSTVKFLN